MKVWRLRSVREVVAGLTLFISAAPAFACEDASVAPDVVALNQRSMTSSGWSFFNNGKKPEGPGWEVYVPQILETLKIICLPDTPGFAAALRQWQQARGLVADGKMGPGTARALKAFWQKQRAHVGRKPCLEIEHGHAQLALVPSGLAAPGSQGRKAHASAIANWQALLNEARTALPGNESGRIISPWRSAKADRAYCVKHPAECNGTNKAGAPGTCSAHWSGFSLDVDVDHAAGFSVIDTSYRNRLHQSRQPFYRWLVANAHRFGFVNYSFEPWHWEWQGSQP